VNSALDTTHRQNLVDATGYLCFFPGMVVFLYWRYGNDSPENGPL
jgi:hypothetical protein